MPSPLRVRRSLDAIQKDYDSGNKAPLDALMRAWKGITKELAPEVVNGSILPSSLGAEQASAEKWQY